LTVRDLIKQPTDIDVFDDVCEELGIAMCGPVELTEAGEKRFSEVLDYEVELHNSGGTTVAIVKVDGSNWRRRLRKAKDFFESAGGYCWEEDYKNWFKEERL